MSLHINRPEIWIKPIFWNKINLERNLLPSPGLTVKIISDRIISGRPQEKESDYCIINIVHQCHFPEMCRNLVIFNENSTSGYALTHRLLIVQMMSAVSHILINNVSP